MRGGLLDVQLLDADSVQQLHVQQTLLDSVQQLHVQQPSTYAKPEVTSAVLGS